MSKDKEEEEESEDDVTNNAWTLLGLL
jgi:hypothetical protein